MLNLPAAGNRDRLAPITSESRPSEPGTTFNQLGPLPDIPRRERHALRPPSNGYYAKAPEAACRALRSRIRPGRPQASCGLAHELPADQRPEDQAILVWIDPFAPEPEIELTVEVTLWFGAPGRDRLFAEPHRQATTLAQGSIIFRPVRYPILLLGDAVTAIGIVLEWHGGHPRRTMDGVAPSLWDCSARLPLAGGSRPAAILTRDREVPLSEERMVLYPNPPKTISPDDPCNNVPIWSSAERSDKIPG
jgi:hypothetical protein